MALPFYALLMAGGSGTRLWPLSRRVHPKQLLKLQGDRSLYRLAVDRLQPLFSPEHILVITAKDMADGLKVQSPEIPERNFIVEPEGRGTAPVIGLGALCAESLAGSEAIIACLTADHLIANVEKFVDALSASRKVADEGGIVTLGIEPTYPATGYGYIERGEWHSEVDGFSVFNSVEFKEKPDEDGAALMSTDGRHYWNSGMFIWRTDTVRSQFEKQLPETIRCLRELNADWGTHDEGETLARLWPKIPKGSIDYAVMEGAKDLLVIPVDIGWSDVGNWGSVYEALRSDLDSNVVLTGEHQAIDTARTLIQSDRIVATVGIKDLIVVDTPDVLLVCAADRAEQVRDIVKSLEEMGRTSLL